MSSKTLGGFLILLGIILAIIPFVTFFHFEEGFKNFLVGIAIGLIANGLSVLFQGKNKEQNVSLNKEIESLKKQLENQKNMPTSLGNGIIVHEQFSNLDVNKIINETKKELKMFVVSGRHILSPQTLTLILNKIKNPNDDSKLQVLALDSIGEEAYVNARNDMMNMPGLYNNYNNDLQKAREYARQITETDPEHKRFDIRFYTKLPTTFFILSDDTLFVTFLLSKPVAECPVFEINKSKFPQLTKQFINHFDFYWNSSRFYSTVIGFKKDSNSFVMVFNRKRQGWEWPTGYIEPAENPIDSAKREFTEETGYLISNLQEVEQTPFGHYYFGIVGDKISDFSKREVSELKEFLVLPEKNMLSFKEDYSLFQDILQEALKLKSRK